MHAPVEGVPAQVARVLDRRADSWWIGGVKSLHRSAALTALCCLWSACGDGIHVASEPNEAARRADAAPESGDLPTLEDGETAPDPDAPTTTVDAPLEAWPLALTTAELGTLDGATFLGDALLVVGRNVDQVVVQRLHRTVEDAAVKVASRSAADRFVALRPGASRVALARLGADVVAAWVADGHLEGVRIGAAMAELTALSPVRLSGEEGGQLSGDPVIAEGHDAERLVACATDTLGPLCFGLDATLSPIAVHTLSKRKSAGTPRALLANDGGFMLVLGSCKGETCARIDMTAIALGPDGKPGKVRDLPVVQLERGTAFIAQDDGFVLVARRVGAAEHTAWRIGEQGVRELEGRFSRVVGGFSHDDRTLLIERAHLKMRKGFPVRGFEVRPLDEGAGRASSKKPTREALPDAVADLLPTEVDQTFAAFDDALVFSAPTRKGRFRATVVRLIEGR